MVHGHEEASTRRRERWDDAPPEWSVEASFGPPQQAPTYLPRAGARHDRDGSRTTTARTRPVLRLRGEDGAEIVPLRRASTAEPRSGSTGAVDPASHLATRAHVIPRRPTEPELDAEPSRSSGSGPYEIVTSARRLSGSLTPTEGPGSDAPAAAPRDPPVRARPRSEPPASREATGEAHTPPLPDVGAAVPGMIDPLAIGIPAELATSIYGWIRRIALQADLPTADRVLRDALAELTGSLHVSIVYPGDDGLWSLGDDEEIPRDATPLVACAQARRAIVTGHHAMIPVVTTTETVAVILLTRNPRNPAYLPAEQIAMIAMARECAAILHHLAVAHLQRESEIEADKGSLYRGEALEAHRTRGSEGQLVNLSPGWVKRTYPLLVIALGIALVFSVFVKVPTYSSGQGVVVIDGLPVTTAQPGTVEHVLVTAGQAVNQGDVIVRLAAQPELDELAAAQSELDAALRSSLWDATDDATKKNLKTAATRLDSAKRKVSGRTIRASRPGVISDIRVRAGQALQFGDPIATIVQPGTPPEISAFLPSRDRPRLRTGMRLQVELVGYTKTRELATITMVGTEAIGGTEVAKLVGPTLADALKLQGSFVHVKARLPARTFRTEHRTLNYHHGMPAQTEVKIVEKPFLVTLLPAIEKYIPE